MIFCAINPEFQDPDPNGHFFLYNKPLIYLNSLGIDFLNGLGYRLITCRLFFFQTNRTWTAKKQDLWKGDNYTAPFPQNKFYTQ